MKDKIVVYQGVEGAYSHLACKKLFPNSILKAKISFYDSMQAVEKEEADFAVIPIENSSAGRVEEIYKLIPKMQLSVVGEHFQPIKHTLLATKGVKIEQLKTVSSHPQALAQCAKNIKRLNLEAIPKFDTAGSAKELEETKEENHGVIASSLASEIYNLEILDENFADYEGNVTRFIILTKKATVPLFEEDKLYITSLLFTVKNIPAALYKALGGFATNGIDLIKLESYSDVGSLYSTQFHVDMYGHIEEQRLIYALDELRFFSEDIKIIGVYERNEHWNVLDINQ